MIAHQYINSNQQCDCSLDGKAIERKFESSQSHQCQYNLKIGRILLLAKKSYSGRGVSKDRQEMRLAVVASLSENCHKPVWWNGRRDKLKPCFSSGSSPEAGTILDTSSNFYIILLLLK